MRIDLHVHSDRSDGAHPPAEVVRFARRAGVDVIALTDHDTVEGLTEAREAGAREGVEVLLGCELSSTLAGASVHVLGYFFDPADPELSRTLEMVRDDRVVRAQAMVEKLRLLGVDVTFERVRQIAKGESVGRPHVAQAMVEAGVIKTTPEAFTKEWIGNGGRAHVEKYSPSPEEAVRLVTEAGGAAVVAHPVWLASDGIGDQELVEQLAAAGLAGLESDHPDHDEGARVRYRRMAERLGLVPTGSSDWHGNAHGGRIGECTTAPAALEALRRRSRG